MKTFLILSLTALPLIGCLSPNEPAPKQDVPPNIGNWLEVPDGFVPFEAKKVGTYGWSTSRVSLGDSELRVVIGPCEFLEPSDGVVDYYAIEIQRPFTENGWADVARMNIPISAISESALSVKAKDVVSFDAEESVVTFDLDGLIFKIAVTVDG